MCRGAYDNSILRMLLFDKPLRQYFSKATAFSRIAYIADHYNLQTAKPPGMPLTAYGKSKKVQVQLLIVK